MPVFNQAVFLDLDTVDRGDLDLSRLRACAGEWAMHGFSSATETPARMAGAEIVVSNKVPLRATELAAAKRLKLIAVAATGTNNVDLEAAARHGVAVCNVPGYSTPSVVQHVFGLILALTLRLADYQRDVHGGRWSSSSLFCLLDHPIRELAGKRLGIVGYGDIGRGVAQVAEAFGMQVLVAQSLSGASHGQGRLPLDRLLAEADVVSLHCPLTERTRGLIDAAALARMKSDALIINTARGAIVDAPALADALRRGIVGGAGIDVLETEPPPPDHPLLAPDIPNLIVTPHVAWASRESRQRLVDELALNIEAFARGESRNRVA